MYLAALSPTYPWGRVHRLAGVTLVRLVDIGVTIGQVPILTSVDLEVAPGECVGITGPNGAGKTTLLRVLATLRQPTSGGGEVLGAQLGVPGVRSVRPRIGLLGHSPALAMQLSLAENLRFHAGLRGLPLERAEQALELVGLGGAANRRGSECSSGMLRRADLGRTFLGEPDLLLLDEPIDGLDQSARPLVAASIAAALDRGGAVVVVSHDPANLDRYASRILGLSDGALDS
jgi:ABC-type multidrug transport system ATPase subunit